jgi:hypothetical protein
VFKIFDSICAFERLIDSFVCLATPLFQALPQHAREEILRTVRQNKTQWRSHPQQQIHRNDIFEFD